MATMQQIEEFRAAVRGLAAELGCSIEHAFDVIYTPDWVWSELSAARDAIGPDNRPFFDLLAPDSADRQAAADRRWAEIKTAVLA